MAENILTDDQTKSKNALCPKVAAAVTDLDHLLMKLYLVEEYALLVQKRDNVACGLDGVSLILGNLTTELGEIIDYMRGVNHG